MTALMDVTGEAVPGYPAPPQQIQDLPCLPAERWLPVPCYQSVYWVSSLGRVWSRPRKGTRGGLLRQSLGEQYLCVSLWLDGRQSVRRVHDLVAEAFLGPRPAGTETLHGPGGQLDNRVLNLRYGTSQENSDDMVQAGRSLRGERQPASKLTWYQVDAIRAQYAAGRMQADIAQEFGISQGSVSDIVNAKRWQPLIENPDLPHQIVLARSDGHCAVSCLCLGKPGNRRPHQIIEERSSFTAAEAVAAYRDWHEQQGVSV